MNSANKVKNITANININTSGLQEIVKYVHRQSILYSQRHPIFLFVRQQTSISILPNDNICIFTYIFHRLILHVLSECKYFTLQQTIKFKLTCALKMCFTCVHFCLMTTFIIILLLTYTLYMCDVYFVYMNNIHMFCLIRFAKLKKAISGKRQ